MNWSDLPQEYRDLANIRPDAFIQEAEDILCRFIVAFVPPSIDFWVKCWQATTVDELPPIDKPIASKEEMQKDIALFVAFFYYHSYTGMGLLSTFDIVYNLGIKFVENYPPNTDWEEQENDYESTAHRFILDNFINKEF